VRLQDFVDCLCIFELLLELVKVRFDDLNHDVVDIVLDKVLHTMSQVITLHVKLIKVELFCRLVQKPCVCQVPLNILAEDQVTEYELVLGDRPS